ncbi:hypothetical protein BGZ65_005425 [Modicella reniformis]|uniref:RGS domain-containing protein n=1 Tax=Modicella reniformis TaxID=1440133 RepID=A0A9P6JNX2_9FUNG|nr:hypothetical protein BGZ65_005425 [Modicella reniformis]
MHFECHSGPEFFYPYANAVIGIFLVSPYMVFQFKGITDGFGIRNELIFIILLSVPCIVLFFVVPTVAGEFTRKYLDRTTWMAMILVTCHIGGIIIPLTQHYRDSPRQYIRTTDDGKGSNIKDGEPGSEDIPMERQLYTNHDSTQPDVNQTQCQSPTTPIYHTQIKIDDYLVNRNSFQKNSSSANLSLKNLFRNQKRDLFGFGRGSHDNCDNIHSKKSDWDEFARVLEDRTLFDRLSAFTVGEFCAENTRFLYEVSRLEKRASQYQHLKDLGGISHDTPQDEVAERFTQHSMEKDPGATDTSPASPQSARLVKSPSTDTRHSIIAPLPTHFSSSSAQTDANQFPYRIKKIVSATSVSSAQPMLGIRRSSSSIFNESETSSPIGSPPPRPSMIHCGSSSTAVIDFEVGIPEQLMLGASLQIDVVNIPNTGFAPLPMPPTLLIQFEYIYKTFIKRGARLELNLSYDISKEIHDKSRRGEWRSGMFDSAINEIQELLFRDVWPKFVTSSHGLYSSDSGSSTPSDPARLQEVGIANSGQLSIASAVTAGPGNHLSLYQPCDPQPSTFQRTVVPMPLIQLNALGSLGSFPKATPKVAAASSNDTDQNGAGTSGSAASFPKNKQECNEAVVQEEPSRLGFKAWLTKTSRTGITATALVSREGDTEEALGIIEQSRRSMGNRRSDISGLYPHNVRK